MRMDMLVRDINVFNSYFKRFIKGNAAIKDGKFYYIGERELDAFEPDTNRRWTGEVYGSRSDRYPSPH